MSPLAFLFLCIQACLIQNAMSACFGAGPAYGFGTGIAAPYGPGYGTCGYGGAYGAYDFGYDCCGAAYGGDGIGNVAVAGELPVGGATAVAGQVPIIGGVQFGGAVPAAGAVTIAGNCACGCGGPYY